MGILFKKIISISIQKSFERIFCYASLILLATCILAASLDIACIFVNGAFVALCITSITPVGPLTLYLFVSELGPKSKKIVFFIHFLVHLPKKLHRCVAFSTFCYKSKVFKCTPKSLASSSSQSEVMQIFSRTKRSSFANSMFRCF